LGEPPSTRKGVGQRALWFDWRRRLSSRWNEDDEPTLNFESRRQPAKGLDPRALWVDWRRWLSWRFILTQRKDALQVIRPCRESATGWTPKAGMPSGNHRSLALNEHGPALKVFWSRRWRDGRSADERTRLPKVRRVVGERLAKKTEPEGAGSERSAPLLSVRIRGQPGHQPTTR
jgi:hypothetical protein